VVGVKMRCYRVVKAASPACTPSIVTEPTDASLNSLNHTLHKFWIFIVCRKATVSLGRVGQHSDTITRNSPICITSHSSRRHHEQKQEDASQVDGWSVTCGLGIVSSTGNAWNTKTLCWTLIYNFQHPSTLKYCCKKVVDSIESPMGCCVQYLGLQVYAKTIFSL